MDLFFRLLCLSLSHHVYRKSFFCYVDHVILKEENGGKEADSPKTHATFPSECVP